MSVAMHRLSEAGDEFGVSCNLSGVFVGRVPLLKRIRGVAGQEIWVPRNRQTLNQALSGAYGQTVEALGKCDGLTVVADALNDGNVGLA